MIIVRGANFYPQDIEWTAQRCHPALELADAAAFSLMVEGEERLGILQELKRGDDPELHDLEGVTTAIRQAVAEEYDIRTCAITLIEAGTIPKTSSGKIQRSACREAFLDGSLESVHRWSEGPGPGARGNGGR